jgi:hypothetical protein
MSCGLSGLLNRQGRGCGLRYPCLLAHFHSNVAIYQLARRRAGEVNDRGAVGRVRREKDIPSTLGQDNLQFNLFSRQILIPSQERYTQYLPPSISLQHIRKWNIISNDETIIPTPQYRITGFQFQLTINNPSCCPRLGFRLSCGSLTGPESGGRDVSYCIVVVGCMGCWG